MPTVFYGFRRDGDVIIVLTATHGRGNDFQSILTKKFKYFHWVLKTGLTGRVGRVFRLQSREIFFHYLGNEVAVHVRSLQSHFAWKAEFLSARERMARADAHGFIDFHLGTKSRCRTEI